MHSLNGQTRKLSLWTKISHLKSKGHGKGGGSGVFQIHRAQHLTNFFFTSRFPFSPEQN
jgi:hypothetical protein